MTFSEETETRKRVGIIKTENYSEETCAFRRIGDELILNDGCTLKLGKDISEEHAEDFIKNLLYNFEHYGDGNTAVHLHDKEKPYTIFSYPLRRKRNAFGTNVICRGGSLGFWRNLFHMCEDETFIEHTLNNPIRYKVCLKCGRVVQNHVFQR
jgi:hypothetical protein